MVKERMDLLELLRKGGMDGDVDFLREALRVLVEGIMDAEVSGRIGAEYGEGSPERVTQRNGYRPRAWDTRVGTMELHIPKLREGSYFPSLLEPRRRSERALLAVIQQAYVEGVSTRRVDDLVKALGCEGISKSQVSRICQDLDEVVEGFLGRPLDGGPYPYLWLDALTQKVREDGRIVNVSVVVATAVNCEGKREIIGMGVGTSEDGAFWLAADSLNAMEWWTADRDEAVVKVLEHGERLEPLARTMLEHPATAWWFDPINLNNQVWISHDKVAPDTANWQRPKSPPVRWDRYAQKPRSSQYQYTSTLIEGDTSLFVALDQRVGDLSLWSPPFQC